MLLYILVFWFGAFFGVAGMAALVYSRANREE